MTTTYEVLAERLAQLGATPDNIRNLIYMNPRLALVLCQPEPPLMVPNSYEVAASFVTGTAGGPPVPAAFQQRTFADCWVQRVVYTVQRPHFGVGSPLAPWYDEFKTRRPGIDVLMELDQEDKYTTTQTAQPIENLFAPSISASPRGFFGWDGMVIQQRGSPSLQLTLTRDLDQGELPMNLRITFHVLEMRGCRYGSVSRMEAIAQLRALGVPVWGREDAKQGGCAK